MVGALPRHNINFNIREYAYLAKGIFSSVFSGRKVLEFEKEFAEYIGLRACFTFSSGSAALYHGIKSSGLMPGDKVIFPEYEFNSVVQTFKLCGLDLIFAKTDPNTGNITPKTASDALEGLENVKGVVVAHIHGKPADMPGFVSFCLKHGLLLIEDCAHSAGAAIGDRKTGSFGDFSIFSFGPGKSLVAGGGGALLTDNLNIAKEVEKRKASLVLPDRKSHMKASALTLFKAGLSTKWAFTFLVFPALYLLYVFKDRAILDNALASGTETLDQAPESYNHLFTDSSAALALSQLGGLDGLNEKRARNQVKLFNRLVGIDNMKMLKLPKKNTVESALNFKIEIADGPALSKYLFKKGIDTRKDYLSLYSESNPKGAMNPNSLYLPNHPKMNFCDIERITGAIKEFLM